MLWLCLQFPQLPLEIFTRATPKAPDQPWVLVDQQRVARCNAAARAHGIRPDMSITTARALLDTVRTIARDPALEHTALADLAQWAYRFTPSVSIVAPDALLLETGTSLKLFRGLQVITRQIDQDLAAQGFSYRLGLGHTPKAARLFARGLPGAKPDWFDSQSQTLDHERLQRALAALPLDLLDCPPATIRRLHKPGFNTLGELLALPRAALGKRFGRDFLRHLEQILGTTPDPQRAIEPEQHFRRRLEFIEPVHRTETLLFPMGRLLDELCHFLMSRQLECPAFHWQLHQQDADAVKLTLQLSQAGHDKHAFMRLTRTRLDTIRLSAPVSALVLDCARFQSSQPLSQSLFDDGLGQHRQALDELLDTLRARLQTDQLYSLACRDEHVPELAWRRLPPGGPGDASQPAPDRPAWLLPEPSPVSHSDNGLHWRGGALSLLLGPERIESHWWDKPVRRDYFIARHQDEGLYWVFVDRAEKRWYVHGIFA